MRSLLLLLLLAAAPAIAFHNTPPPAVLPPCNADAPMLLIIPPDSTLPSKLTCEQLTILIRQQPIEYLRAVVPGAAPPAAPTFKVAKVNAISTNPGLAELFYVAGSVVETATRVQVRVDGAGVYTDANLVTHSPGHPKSFTWPVPVKFQDGKPHAIAVRVYRQGLSTAAYADNAPPGAPWAFTLGGAPPGPSEPPQPVPPKLEFVAGRMIGSNMPPAAATATIVLGSASSAPIPIAAGAFSWKQTHFNLAYVVVIKDAAGKELQRFTGTLPPA